MRGTENEFNCTQACVRCPQILCHTGCSVFKHCSFCCNRSLLQFVHFRISVYICVHAKLFNYPFPSVIKPPQHSLFLKSMNVSLYHFLSDFTYRTCHIFPSVSHFTLYDTLTQSTSLQVTLLFILCLSNIPSYRYAPSYLSIPLLMGIQVVYMS